MNPLCAPLPRVDFHHHVMPVGLLPDSFAEMWTGKSAWRFPAGTPIWSPQRSIEFMDDIGIDTAILSLPNDVESMLPPRIRQGFAREVNTFAKQMAEEFPGRFGFFAHLPTPTDLDAALSEMTFAFDELGADGVTLTNVYGAGEDARSIGDPTFEPLWDELDRRGALVFLHGEQTPGRNRAPSAYLPTPVSEVPNETYKAAADLVTSGRKRQYPNARIILSHSGGSTPFLAARVAGLCAFHLKCELSPTEILEDFRTFYYETALSGFTTNLVALEDFVDTDHILFGTDFPAVSPQTAAWYTTNVDQYFTGRPDVLAKVMHSNAHSLIPRLRSSGLTTGNS